MSRSERHRLDMEKFFKSDAFKKNVDDLRTAHARGHTYSEEYTDGQLLNLYNKLTPRGSSWAPVWDQARSQVFDQVKHEVLNER